MALSREEGVRELAGLVGITIAEEAVPEVSDRFGGLVLELERLKELDLGDMQPVVTGFLDEGLQGTSQGIWVNPPMARTTQIYLAGRPASPA